LTPSESMTIFSSVSVLLIQQLITNKGR
jgi:hypothetical protein